MKKLLIRILKWIFSWYFLISLSVLFLSFYNQVRNKQIQDLNEIVNELYLNQKQLVEIDSIVISHQVEIMEMIIELNERQKLIEPTP